MYFPINSVWLVSSLFTLCSRYKITTPSSSFTDIHLYSDKPLQMDKYSGLKKNICPWAGLGTWGAWWDELVDVLEPTGPPLFALKELVGSLSARVSSSLGGVNPWDLFISEVGRHIFLCFFGTLTSDVCSISWSVSQVIAPTKQVKAGFSGRGWIETGESDFVFLEPGLLEMVNWNLAKNRAQCVWLKFSLLADLMNSRFLWSVKIVDGWDAPSSHWCHSYMGSFKASSSLLPVS